MLSLAPQDTPDFVAPVDQFGPTPKSGVDVMFVNGDYQPTIALNVSAPRYQGCPAVHPLSLRPPCVLALLCRLGSPGCTGPGVVNGASSRSQPRLPGAPKAPKPKRLTPCTACPLGSRTRCTAGACCSLRPSGTATS